MEDSYSNYKELDSNNKSYNENSSNKSDYLINKLVELGFRSKMSKRLVYILHPPSVEQAIEYLSEHNGIIQHYFLEQTILPNKCYICQKRREQHISRRNINLQSIYNNNSNNSNSSINDSYSSRSIQIKNYSKEVEKKMGKKICIICDKEYMQSSYTTLEKCSHSFCKSCWRHYLSVNIKEKKLIKIKCMESSCNVILPEKFIYFLIKRKDELISRFNENKLRQEILDNPRKKFCPFPDCNSYARRNNKEENIVKCENGHLFCFYCLQKPHKGKKCGKELDEKMEEFAKKKFIKKCPKCHIWSEKISGCNHITCVECGYQWCWLCNQKYDPTHYEKGKCKGFQFFKPNNEKDIQLAFEGKIKLRDDERMRDFNSYSSDSDSYFSFSFDHPLPPTNNINNTELGLMEKIKIFIILLMFGNIVIIICESGRYFDGANMRLYVFLTYLTIIIIFGFIFFIFQIFLNIILFIFLCIRSAKKRTFYYFKIFNSMLKKIIKLDVWYSHEYEINEIFFIFVFHFFFGCFFWTFELIDRKYYFNFLSKRADITKKIFLLSYGFILFLSIIFIYPLPILINIIGIIWEIINIGFSTLKYYSIRHNIRRILND